MRQQEPIAPSGYSITARAQHLVESHSVSSCRTHRNKQVQWVCRQEAVGRILTTENGASNLLSNLIRQLLHKPLHRANCPRQLRQETRATTVLSSRLIHAERFHDDLIKRLAWGHSKPVSEAW